MRIRPRISLLMLLLLAFNAIQLTAEDLISQVRKAVEKSTLDQQGTHPFHLKATYAPSQERDNSSNRVGQIEIWWQSPTQWRREVTSPDFHQLAIVNGTHQWQKNDGNYFPEWLRELAQAIVRPVPLPIDSLLQRVKSAEVRQLMTQTNINWDPASNFGTEQENGKGHLALNSKTGLINYTGGPGFGGNYSGFQDFHGRMIARSVASGYIEVTAKISVLEDLASIPPNFFDATIPDGDPHPIETAALSEVELRKSLIPGKPFDWPPLKDGPLEGVVWTEVTIDRTGKIRESIPAISDNPGLKEEADQGFAAMQFQPILRDGIPVQATGRISVNFKTVRPAGIETFDSAKTYFERGRKATSLAAAAVAPYTLRAEFQIGTASGIQTGKYEDTWLSPTEWKREAWLNQSHYVRSQDGDKHYLLAEGPEAKVLAAVLAFVEPIPAEDTMTESDWRIRRDTVNGISTVRVFRGPEGQNGELEPGKSQGYWFDETGRLVKSYTAGVELRSFQPEPFSGIQIPRRIDVVKDGSVGLRIQVKEVIPADPDSAKTFKLKGHEWQRAFTSETR